MILIDCCLKFAGIVALLEGGSAASSIRAPGTALPAMTVCEMVANPKAMTDRTGAISIFVDPGTMYDWLAVDDGDCKHPGSVSIVIDELADRDPNLFELVVDANNRTTGKAVLGVKVVGTGRFELNNNWTPDGPGRLVLRILRIQAAEVKPMPRKWQKHQSDLYRSRR